LIQKFKNIKH